MTKLPAIFSAIILLSACTAFNRSYVIKERAENFSFAPAWTVQRKAHRVESSSASKQYLYFVHDAQNANLRLCLKTSETEATRETASVTAKEIVNRFKSKNKAQKNIVTVELRKSLEQNILINLYNVVVAGEYWEKREYLKEKGAEKNYTAYKCDTVVKIKRTDLAKAIEASKARISQQITDKSKKAWNSSLDSYIADLKIEN